MDNLVFVWFHEIHHERRPTAIALADLVKIVEMQFARLDGQLPIDDHMQILQADTLTNRVVHDEDDLLVFAGVKRANRVQSTVAGRFGAQQYHLIAVLLEILVDKQCVMFERYEDQNLVHQDVLQQLA